MARDRAEWAEYMRLWRTRNPEKARAIKQRSNLKRREVTAAYGKGWKTERREWLDGIKQASGCIDCGSHERLEFDHVRGEKLFTIGRECGKPLAVLQAEIAKCEVRCGPCHRKRPNHGLSTRRKP